MKLRLAAAGKEHSDVRLSADLSRGRSRRHRLQHVAASAGMASGDLEKLKEILKTVPDISFICLDVANGYSEHFVAFVKEVRQLFPTHTIVVSGVW